MAVHELDLVVGVVGDQVVRGLELDEVVPATLETTTERPPAVSTSAAVDPPGPEPTMMTSKSRLTAG
jgi:hypothetical protein